MGYLSTTLGDPAAHTSKEHVELLHKDILLPMKGQDNVLVDPISFLAGVMYANHSTTHIEVRTNLATATTCRQRDTMNSFIATTRDQILEQEEQEQEQAKNQAH